MERAEKLRSRIFNSSSPAATAVAAFLFVLVVSALSVQPAQAQGYTAVYNFSGGGDGAHPLAGVTMDALGNLYGTTAGFFQQGNNSCLRAPAGAGACGTVFKLSREESGWVLSTIYSFSGGAQGARPAAPLTLAADGSLYGTTYMGGGTGCGGVGCGTVFQLTPSADGSWTETVLYRFSGGLDGATPGTGALLLAGDGSLYGTTTAGGQLNAGVVFEVARSGSGWTETVIHAFGSQGDGAIPWSGLITDPEGNMFGTTVGGAPGGDVYELSPSNGGWDERVIAAISCEFCDPGLYGGLVRDSEGNLYGASEGLGGAGGAAFVVSPSGNDWNLNYIYAEFRSPGPTNSLVVAVGELGLYGTADGAVFELVPPPVFNWRLGWNGTDLAGLGGGLGDSGVILGSDGNLYGATAYGGSSGNGMVYAVTP